jgi:hypothetical protein
MNVEVQFEDNASPHDSSEMQRLMEALADADLRVQPKQQRPKSGSKDSGLMVGLTIVGLVLSGIGTVASVLSTWTSMRDNYSVSITRGHVTVTINGLSSKDLHEAVKQLRLSKGAPRLVVHISRRS